MAERRNGCLIGCLVAGVLGVGLLALLGFGIFAFVGAADESMIDRQVYDAVKTGDAESEVRAKLPEGDNFITDALKGGGPAQPAGATCVWYAIADDSAGSGAEDVFRFCFKDGKLAQKSAYRSS
ncbi:hypothetical protein ACM614_16775 [Streptomyces sp. 12297]